jgi:hypothetical protein
VRAFQRAVRGHLDAVAPEPRFLEQRLVDALPGGEDRCGRRGGVHGCCGQDFVPPDLDAGLRGVRLGCWGGEGRFGHGWD